MLKNFLNFQHYMNPLHVHCRLVEIGFNKNLSISICKYYQVLIYSWLVWFTIVGVRLCRLLRMTD